MDIFWLLLGGGPHFGWCWVVLGDGILNVTF